MATFNFYQDQKTTVWDRNRFSVEASTYDEAVEKVRSIKDLLIAESEQNGIKLNSCETLFDTMEHLSPEDNGGCPTLEIFNENGEEITNNAE